MNETATQIAMIVSGKSPITYLLLARFEIVRFKPVGLKKVFFHAAMNVEAKMIRVLLGCLLVLSVSGGISGASSVECGFSSTGLTSLKFNGVQFLSRGEFQVNAISFTTASGHDSLGVTHGQLSVDVAQKTENLAFDWGTIDIRYQASADKLTMRIGIKNSSKLILKSISLDALAFQMPSTPRQYSTTQPTLGTNVGTPTILPFDFSGGSIIVTNDDVRRPLLLGMPWPLNPPAKTVFPIRINTGREPMYPNSLPFIDRPIAPGGHDEFVISLRFSIHAADSSASASDVISGFTHMDPFALHWPDRRPIGSLTIATANANWKTNPRGWLLDSKIDVTTPAGVKEFQSRLLHWADQSVAILKRMDAQGMITWDVEGEQFPHSITYIGDPSLSANLAPEIDSVLDEYFARFRKAGLRVGVTVRPQKFERNATGGKQVDVPDPAAELIRKITYAKKRWGATLFYIDSNGDPVLPLKAEVISQVAHSFPGVLLIPEHKNIAYYANSAPYSESKGGFYATPSLIAAIYPASFSVINTADGAVEKHYNELLAAVNRGDILMFRSWFDDPANAIIKAIYAHSTFKAR